jgi:hypothetical protein
MAIGRTVGGPLAAAALALGLGACGGSDGPGPCPTGQMGTPPNCTPIVVEPPCTQTVVDSGNGSANPSTAYYNDFSVPESGRLDITVDWTDPGNHLAVWVVPVHTCSIDELNARSCNFLVRSESASGPKPLKISTPNFAAGNYTWIIGNPSANQESIAFQFVLSKGTCAALAGRAPGASGRATGSGATFEHAQTLH